MSLNWNIKDVRDYESLWSEDRDGMQRLDGMVETMILLSVRVGINKITEDNWEEYAQRLIALDSVEGPFLHQKGDDGWEPRPFTPADVHRMIGLSTNCSPLTPTKFWKSIREGMEDRVSQEIRQFKRDNEAAMKEAA